MFLWSSSKEGPPLGDINALRADMVKLNVPAVVQKDIKKLLPPGGIIWRSRTDGAWCGRWKGMAPKSARDSAWGNEISAVRAVLRHVWHDYLQLSGYDRDICPITDLWQEGAGGFS